MLSMVDIHLRHELAPRAERWRARRDGNAPRDWSAWRRRLVTETPPGIARLQRLATGGDRRRRPDDEMFIATAAEALAEAAAAGCGYAELRFDGDTVDRPGFMALFREAEERVRRRFPDFCAEAVIGVMLWQEPDRLRHVLDVCVRAAADGLAGIELLYVPYTSTADWSTGRRVAGLAAEAGLGVSVHAGEFGPANIAAAAGIEGVSRIVHATHAAARPELLDVLAESRVTVEVCLTANIVLGAVSGPREHPLREFLASGVPVALGSQYPVQLGGDIAGEYRLAAELGVTEAELALITGHAITAAFTSADRKAAMTSGTRTGLAMTCAT